MCSFNSIYLEKTVQEMEPVSIMETVLMLGSWRHNFSYSSLIQVIFVLIERMHKDW